MAYTASQNPKTGTTYMAAALFATLILLAGIAALAMQPAEAFAKPLCDENDDGICDNYENGLCPGKGLDHGSGNGWGSASSTQNGNTYGYSNGNGYGARVNGCGYAYSHGHGACSGFVGGCQRAQNCPNR